jgi:hypothetical protein
VYVISNIGTFGEGCFKIGLTRRLDPLEHVKELGDASVPFPFDVHAVIFSEDAPALEAALHRDFADRRVNKVNMRKEFFRVTLDEIRQVVEKHTASSPALPSPTPRVPQDLLPRGGVWRSRQGKLRPDDDELEFLFARVRVPRLWPHRFQLGFLISSYASSLIRAPRAWQPNRSP